jgi:hypothetical protein
MLRLAFIAFLLSAAGVADAQVTSSYTDIAENSCKKLKADEENGILYEAECPGVAGFKLNLLEGDLRQTINIVDPKKKLHELGLWYVFPGYSAVGQKAEWLVKDKKPFALILRVNVAEDPQDLEKRTSYLVVAKITEKEVCVTETIKPNATQNADARKAADRSGSRPCWSRD